MENLIIYLAKASGIMAVFYIGYYTLLKNETFFYSNRKFLIAGLFSAAVLPLLVLTRTILVEPMPSVPMQEIDLNVLMQLQSMPPAQPVEKPFNWFGLLCGVYLAGVAFFLLRFAADLLSIRKMLRGQQTVIANGIKYIDSPNVNSPFSFFNYIVYNSAILSETELESILNHEKVHSRQAHSLDMIISQLFCITFWFNPFAWLYKKAVAQNLEFIADAEATRQVNDTIAYQKALLKITVQPDCTAIINHFYQSLIKKRIVMLNKKQSKIRNSWKYAAVLPAIVAFMVLFQLEVRAQEQEHTVTSVTIENTKIAFAINKDMDDEAFEAEKKLMKSEFNVDVNFSNIKRNAKGEITAIRVTAKDGTEEAVYEVSGSSPIETFTLEVFNEGNEPQKVRFGTGNDTKIKGKIINVSENEDIQIYGNGYIEVPEPTTPPAPPAHPMINGNGTQIKGDDRIVVLNGKVVGRNVQIQIPANEEVTSLIQLDKKEAKKKYGKEGKKGAFEINTRRATGRYTMHNLGGLPSNQMQMYIGGEEGISFEDMHAQIARMKELSLQLKAQDLAMLDQLKAQGLSKEEILAISEQIRAAQDELRKISSDDMQTFTFNVEDFKSASAAMEQARATMEAHREELAALREEMRGQRDKERAEMEKVREEQRKAAEEQRKAAEEQRKKVQEQRKI